jgi:hypothetical protein
VFIDPALATMIPSDTIFIAGMRVDKLRGSPFYKRLIEDRNSSTFDKLKTETGIDVRKDLWQILLADNGKQSVILARGKFSEFGREPRLERQGARRFSYKGYLMLGDEQMAVMFPNSSTAMAGPAPLLRAVVDRRDSGGNRLPKHLQEQLNGIPASSQIFAAGDPSANSRLGKVDAPGNAANLLQFVRSIESVAAGVDLQQGLDADFKAVCRTEEDAKRFNATIRAVVGLARLNTPDDRPELLRALDGIRSDASARTVTLKGDLSVQQFDQLLNFAQSRMGR